MINIKNENSNKKLIATISIITLLLCFKSSNPWSSFPIGNELFWWLVQLVFLGTVLRLKSNLATPSIEKNLFFVKLYLSWNLICIIRGVFTADNYWEWKFLLATSFFLLLPLLVYIVHNTATNQSISNYWFRYAPFIYIILSPFVHGDGVGKFLIPFSFLALFFSVLSSKWKIIVFVVTVFVISYDVTARSNVIKFLIPLILANLVYFRAFRSVINLNISRLLLLFAPLLLFFLATTGNFNVFNMEDYIGEYNVKANADYSARYDSAEEENLTVDSRSFLYVEVLESAIKHNYVLLGRTPARGNDSNSFGDYLKETLQTGKQERFSNEVSILNIFTWLGLVGVVLYFLIFYKATYLAINRSNNTFIKLIGLNVAFRWAYGWVEDFSIFDLSNIFLWIMIGMCFSETFRSMTNREFKSWVLGIFEKPKAVKIEMGYNPLALSNNEKPIYK